MATPTYSTTPDTLVLLPTLSDVGRQPETKMTTCKPEVRYISGLDCDIREVPVATPTFSTTPDSLVILALLSWLLLLSDGTQRAALSRVHASTIPLMTLQVQLVADDDGRGDVQMIVKR